MDWVVVGLTLALLVIDDDAVDDVVLRVEDVTVADAIPDSVRAADCVAVGEPVLDGVRERDWAADRD